MIAPACPADERLDQVSCLLARSSAWTVLACELHPDDQPLALERAERLARRARTLLTDVAEVDQVVARAVALCAGPADEDTQDDAPADLPEETEYDGLRGAA